MLKFSAETIVAASAMQPCMFRAASGDLLACGVCWHYQNDGKLIYGEKYRYPGMARWLVSHDQGNSWQEVQYVGETGHGQDVVVSGIELPDGRYLLYEMYTLPTDKAGHFMARLWIAQNGFRNIEGPIGAPISVPEAVPNCDDNGGQNVGGPCLWRSIVQLPSGDLLATAYGRFRGDDTPVDHMPSSKKCRCFLIISRDEGHSWKYLSTIAVDPTVGEEGFNETTMVRVNHGVNTGRLLCHMRTGSLGGVIYRAMSKDDGKTWSTPEPLDARGVDPCLTELSDGTLAFSFGTRLGDRKVSGWKHGNKIMFSHDGGDTWSEPIEVPYQSKAPGVYQNPCYLDTSYTSLLELAPGKLLLAYDIGSTGKRGPLNPNYMACCKIDVEMRQTGSLT
ncbi:MAG: sialidase family protein [Victivallales bacterium]